MDVSIGLIYEFHKKTWPKNSKDPADWRYHYFVATVMDASELQGHMLTSTLVQYENNESLEEKHFKPFFADGQECELKFKNSQFLKIPLIKLTATELMNAGLHIKPVGQLTTEGLELIKSKKSTEQAMTWQEYLLKYRPFKKPVA